MAYLLELLADKLQQWPDNATELTQGKSGNLYNQESEVVGCIKEIAENQDYEIVTRAKWESERAKRMKG